jgi:hypothetical protein
MSNIVIVLYTAVGGAIGAGLTQYLTHLRDRRSARASVIERLSETEELFIELSWPLSDESPYKLPRMPKLLGALEAAALIAGVPRTIITLYSTSCRFHEDSRRLSNTADLLASRLASVITENTNTLLADPNLSDVKNRLEQASENIVSLTSRAKDLYNNANTLHDNSLELVGTALWRPYAFRLSIRRLHKLQKSARTLENNIRKLKGSLRQLESTYDQVASGNIFGLGQGNHPLP